MTTHLKDKVQTFTRTEFLNTYREVLTATYEWAKDSSKLDRYMEGVEQTILGRSAMWLCDGNALAIAWREVGGKHAPTLGKLRALMPSLAAFVVAGFILINDTRFGTTTIGYYGTEARCNHVLTHYMKASPEPMSALADGFPQRYLCVPDDHELVGQGI